MRGRLATPLLALTPKPHPGTLALPQTQGSRRLACGVLAPERPGRAATGTTTGARRQTLTVVVTTRLGPGPMEASSPGGESIVRLGLSEGRGPAQGQYRRTIGPTARCPTAQGWQCARAPRGVCGGGGPGQLSRG